MISATYKAANQFEVGSDKTANYKPGLRVTCYMGTQGNAEVSVVESVYQEAQLTTLVTIIGATLRPELYRVSLGNTYADPVNLSGNIGEHGHKGRWDGGHMPASGFSDTQVDTLQTIDTPQNGDAHKIVKVSPDPGNGYQLASLTGTVNRVSVTSADGQVILSTPQDIDINAVPTFAGLALSGLTGIMEAKGASAIGVVTATGSLQIFRRNSTNTAYEFASVNLGELGDLNLTGAAAGDILFRNASNKWVNLAKGNDGDLLTLVSGLPAWITVALKHLSDVADTVTDNGAVGDLMVRGASVYDRLPVGNDKQVLGVVSGSPAWRDVPDGDMFTLMMLCV